MDKPSVEFWFDFASTYSYLSVYRIEQIAREHGITIRWKPFLLGPIFNSQGWDTSPFNIYKAKGNYMWRDITRLSEKYQIPFKRPSQFPRNGLLAARIALAYEQEGWVSNFIRAVFIANFVEDKDISHEEVLSSILNSFGLDADQIITYAKTQENKDKLREQSQLAADKAIFGAPSFVIGNEIFWGNDRLEDAFLWYKKL
ncbi:MAG: 2-hydroxychromene-2-carboxylate isomerase [Thermodesulfobacteriales bacterium]|nr:MAG: 2-hydroxychromene-2-carboxylate isomerase [Thermodesulfobacteriales bacterium]